MNQQEISSQYERYLDGKLSSGEANELLAALALPENQELAESLLVESFTKQEASHQLTDRAEKRILAHIFKHKQRRPWPRIAVAASILLCCSIGLFIYQHNKQTNTPTQGAKNDIAPGHNQATLTLANGQKIVLTKGLKGLLATQNNTAINATQNNIVYEAKHQTGDQISYNTLSTARGEQSPLSLVLADGTKAWLNAESSITYPVAFNGKDRTVSIKGEVYFEVAHNSKQPFRVKTASQTIEDIGTHFNVNAYADEPATLTTLLEGAVKVNGLTIKPGQQTDGNKITEANTDAIMAWRKGYFEFDEENIQPIMRRIARWYNVDIVYTGDAPTDKFLGYVPRFSNASQVLKKLELTNKVHFKIEGRRIMVSR